MKKRYYSVLVLYSAACWGAQEAKTCSSRAAVAPFNVKITAHFSRTVDDLVRRAVIIGFTCETNALMAIALKQQQELAAGKLSQVPLSEELMMKTSLNPVYQDLLDSARQQQKKSSKEGNRAWAEFRKKASHYLGRTIEQGSGITIIDAQKDPRFLLEYNKMLSPADQERYAAGMIALFSLIQMAEEGTL